MKSAECREPKRGSVGDFSRRACAWIPALLLLAGPLAGLRAEPVQTPAAAGASAVVKTVAAVRVNATDQPWDFLRPWSKRAPYSRRAIGAVLSGGGVIVTAELIANSSYLELEKAESGEKIAANVAAVDYEANLALLKPSDPAFLKNVPALELTDAVVGDRVSVWQLENTGALLATDALVTTTQVSHYPTDDTSLLTYQLTSSLQYREGSFTVPVVKNGRLAGVLMRFDPRTQNVDVIPAPVIAHFLKDAADSHYGGFPRAGLLFAAMRDPQLRRYAKVGSSIPGGVYLTSVPEESPAGRAGLRAGDVLLSIGGKAIDQDGNYADERYGKISMVHLIAMRQEGEEVAFQILRDGKPQQIAVKLAHRAASDFVVDPYVIDRAPRYYVLGGLVLQELSRQYLKEWGADWAKKAPERFVYADRYQAELFDSTGGGNGDARKKIVILSQVLPSASTVGYEQLATLTVTKINGVALQSLADIPAALEKAAGGFHKIELEENPRVIYLDARQVAAENDTLMKNYGLPAISRLE